MKDLKTTLTAGKFSQVSREISKALGGKQLPFKIIPLQLFMLGKYEMPSTGKVLDLGEYFIDSEGSIYSRNNDTYFTKNGKHLEKLSDSSFNSSGNIINTFRATDGTKVTIKRQTLVFMRDMGKFTDVTAYGFETSQAGVYKREQVG